MDFFDERGRKRFCSFQTVPCRFSLKMYPNYGDKYVDKSLKLKYRQEPRHPWTSRRRSFLKISKLKVNFCHFKYFVWNLESTTKPIKFQGLTRTLKIRAKFKRILSNLKNNSLNRTIAESIDMVLLQITENVLHTMCL